MVKRFIALGQVAPDAAAPQQRSRRPGLATGPGIWRPGTGGVNAAGFAGGNAPEPVPGPDDAVISSAYHMDGEGWMIAWIESGRVYRIVRENDPTHYRIDRDFLDGCDYSELPEPMAHDLTTWAELTGHCDNELF